MMVVVLENAPPRLRGRLSLWLAEVRAQLPSLANRRPSAYRWPTAPAGVDPEASPAPR